MGASVALAGLTACTEQPVEKILPYTKTPDGMVPGNPLHYATALAPDGLRHAACWSPAGRAARSRWRATPAPGVNHGATGPLEQAAGSASTTRSAPGC